MTLQEAIKSGKAFKRPSSDTWCQHFEAKTGPYSLLVACDYFVDDGNFTTSIDLYGADILATDWVIKSESQVVYLLCHPEDGRIDNVAFSTEREAIDYRGNAPWIIRKFVRAE
jgi:hypothetical protein